MALANIAVLLAQRGLKVLTVDWDLEAPGLERYFADCSRKNAGEEDGAGLLDLLMQAKAASSPSDWPDWRQYVTVIDTPIGELATILAGRGDKNYATDLENFDWSDFFDNHEGGDFFEMLREDWIREYDVTLIDSRTGFTDSGGVCTIQMPDVLIAVFTASHQSLYGLRDAVQMAQDARQNLEYDRMPLLVLPLASRWDGRAELDESREWLERIAKTLGHFYDSWLPSDYDPIQILERTKVPHVAHFSFGEKLPAISHGTTDPELPGYAYDAYATLISTEFKDADQLIIGPPSGRGTKRADRITPKARINKQKETVSLIRRKYILKITAIFAIILLATICFRQFSDHLDMQNKPLKQINIPRESIDNSGNISINIDKSGNISINNIDELGNISGNNIDELGNISDKNWDFITNTSAKLYFTPGETVKFKFEHNSPKRMTLVIYNNNQKILVSKENPLNPWESEFIVGRSGIAYMRISYHMEVGHNSPSWVNFPYFKKNEIPLEIGSRWDAIVTFYTKSRAPEFDKNDVEGTETDWEMIKDESLKLYLTPNKFAAFKFEHDSSHRIDARFYNNNRKSLIGKENPPNPWKGDFQVDNSGIVYVRLSYYVGGDVGWESYPYEINQYDPLVISSKYNSKITLFINYIVFD